MGGLVWGLGTNIQISSGLSALNLVIPKKGHLQVLNFVRNILLTLLLYTPPRQLGTLHQQLYIQVLDLDAMVY